MHDERGVDAARDGSVAETSSEATVEANHSVRVLALDRLDDLLRRDPTDALHDCYQNHAFRVVDGCVQ